jgi:hypothetical protein
VLIAWLICEVNFTCLAKFGLPCSQVHISFISWPYPTSPRPNWQVTKTTSPRSHCQLANSYSSCGLYPIFLLQPNLVLSYMCPQLSSCKALYDLSCLAVVEVSFLFQLDSCKLFIVIRWLAGTLGINKKS